MTTVPNPLVEWERAEIARSGLQARLTAAGPRRTPHAVIARYANPPADTAYALEYAFHLLGDASGQHVLDLGCGDGEFTTLVVSHGARVTALDISTDLLMMARDRTAADGAGRSVAPLCASIHAIPLADASVDVVFGMAVLHHVDLARAAGEIHRVLRPGGRAIFKEPVRNSKVVAAVRRLIPYRQPDVSPFERPLRLDEIRAFASRFRSWHGRAFDLPFVQLLRVCGVPVPWQHKAYARSHALLSRWRWLEWYASALVFEVRK
jgi:SAM-dependent methyltransferase